MHTIHKTTYRLIISLILVVAVFAVYSFVFFTIAKNKNNIADFSREIAVESGKQANVANLQKSLKDASLQNTELDSFIVHSTDIVSFLDSLEKIAADTNTQLSISKVDLSSDTPPYLSVVMKMTGDYEHSIHFISLLENAPYKIEITKITTVRTSAPQSNSKKIIQPAWATDISINLKSFIVSK